MKIININYITPNRKKADTLEYYVRIWKSTTNKEVEKKKFIKT